MGLYARNLLTIKTAYIFS